MIKPHQFVVSFSLFMLCMVGCNSVFIGDLPVTPDLQATIEAGVKGTAEARPSSLPVENTLSPVPQTDTPTPQDDPIVIDNDLLGIGELASTINQTANDLAWTSQEIQTTFNQVSSDKKITPEENTNLINQLNQGHELVLSLERYITEFHEHFGGLVDESDAILQDITSQNQQLIQVFEQLESQENTELNELSSMIKKIAMEANNLQAAIINWSPKLANEMELRSLEVTILKADSVPIDKIAALLRAYDYLDMVKLVIGNGSIDREELVAIARVAANTAAGLNAHGGLKELSIIPEMHNITHLLAMGELSQVVEELPVFESLLGRRPVFPSTATVIPTGANIYIQPLP